MEETLLLNSSNAHIIRIDEKEIILLGTAHVSKNSAQEVKKIIEQEQPESVCVELCSARYENIKIKKDGKKWILSPSSNKKKPCFFWLI